MLLDSRRQQFGVREKYLRYTPLLHHDMEVVSAQNGIAAFDHELTGC
jgi:hypothetical protein